MNAQERGIDIGKKIARAAVSFGVIDISVRMGDTFAKDASPLTRGVMRLGALFLGGWAGDKAGGYCEQQIDKGLRLARKYTKMDISEEDSDEGRETE